MKYRPKLLFVLRIFANERRQIDLNAQLQALRDSIDQFVQFWIGSLDDHRQQCSTVVTAHTACAAYNCAFFVPRQ